MLLKNSSTEDSYEMNESPAGRFCLILAVPDAHTNRSCISNFSKFFYSIGAKRPFEQPTSCLQFWLIPVIHSLALKRWVMVRGGRPREQNGPQDNSADVVTKFVAMSNVFTATMPACAWR